jgi:hypothetical protein
MGYTCISETEVFSMSVAKGRTFRSGNSEALRLPKDVAFGADVEELPERPGL